MIKILHKANISVRSTFCAALVLGAFASFLPDAHAQTYPTKPIRLVVPNTPGSGPDLIARLIGAGLTKALGQQVYIDNRDGASGRIGMEIAARAPADGYTMVIISGQTTIVEAMSNTT
jgi:tripartite-type tricarboxylate transporter receptor subunit TctC